VAEHSFRTLLLMQFSAHARIAKTNMPSLERSFYLLNTRTICAIFSIIESSVSDGFRLLLQRYVGKGNDKKIPAILSFFFVTERTQLNKAHAQLLDKIETNCFCRKLRFLTIQSLEFREI